MSEFEYKKEEEINDTKMKRPHLVILGAGASYAAFPNGDKNGRKLPLMKNLVEVIGLEEDLKSYGVMFEGRNFEELYASIHNEDCYKDLAKILEQKIYDYFDSMELPDDPTIYDLLVLGLREKDVIATFNWDPFLMQALRRNGFRLTKKLPKAIFLHGNVAVGYSEKDGAKILGPKNGRGSTGHILEPTKILYPVSEKNYSNDEFISDMWREIERVLKRAYMVTIFGYGAPESDIEAIKLFKNAWGNVEERQFEEIEIIDIRDKEELSKVWDIFIHTHHYEVVDSFSKSQIFNHPRRSLEALFARIFDAKFTEGNPYGKLCSFEELDAFLKPIIAKES